MRLAGRLKQALGGGRKFQSTQHRQLRVFPTHSVTLISRRRRGGGHEAIRPKALKLYGIRTGFRSDLNEIFRKLHVTVVVNACLGNDKAWMPQS